MQIQSSGETRHVSDVTRSVKAMVLGISVELPYLVISCRGKSTVSALRGEGSACDIHFDCGCYHPMVARSLYPPKDYGQVSHYTNISEGKNIAPCGTPDGSE